MEQMDVENSLVQKKRFDLIIMVNSANSYENRRKSIRSSWMNYVRNTNKTIHHETFNSVEIKFVLGKKDGVDVSEELKTHDDIIFVNVDDSYDNLARKTLEFMKYCMQHYDFDYFMHADDDSFVRIDLLVQLLQHKPKEKYYYGYIWNNGLRVTKPLRNPTAKSYMPYEQYPSEEPYPPFACGCGFILTKDLVAYLADGYKDYRLVDVAFGMYLESINKQIIIENDERIRPYRPLPLFLPDTVVQHYMKPEEFRGYYMKSIGREPHEDSQQAQDFYNMMAAMGLMKK